MTGPDERNEMYGREDLSGAELEALEAMLTRSLRPVDAPAGFADRVMQRVGVHAVPLALEARGSAGRGLGRMLTWPSARLEGWGAGLLAAAALALAVFAGEQTHVKHVQERELAARRASANQQFEASMRIVDRTLEQTRERLRQAGVAGVE